MNQIDPIAISNAANQVRKAIAETKDEVALVALQSSLRVLDALSGSDSSTTTKKGYAGCLAYTLGDSEWAPFGREIDVLVHYNWTNYNRADEPFAEWGATIEDVEVIAVRPFDEDGEDVADQQPGSESAWDVIGEQEELLRDACTEHGYHNGVGEAPHWYSPPRPIPVADNTGIVARMAPSQPSRDTEQRTRRLG